MVFSSYEFICLFILPVVCGYYLFARVNYRYAAGFLLFASLLFYSFWSFAFLFLLIGSILFNYGIGSLIHKRIQPKVFLTLGCVVNLLGIFYFKYFTLAVGLLSHILPLEPIAYEIILPLGISFYTFTQIAYLVDTYEGKNSENYSFMFYALFVTYFPHLIAGPVLHHKEMVSQFADKLRYRVNYDNLAIGLTFFVMGLFKKVVIADKFAIWVHSVFDAAHQGSVLTPLEAWCGVLSYTLQLYFDFSGYSDMAVGLSKMFNFNLPFNFNSPYKAKNLIDFWRRWHMSLSNFLRDYLYIRLGGNRLGPVRRYINLFVTMALGGLWHGANLTFLFWGVFHGLGLIVNHFWRAIMPGAISEHFLYKATASMITLLFVVLMWTIFRSDSMSDAAYLMGRLFDVSSYNLMPKIYQPFLSKYLGDSVGYVEMTHLFGYKQPIVIIVLFIFCRFAYNTQELILNQSTGSAWWVKYIIWRPSYHWFASLVLFAATSWYFLSDKTEFLYFQF